ncbi:piggyBac transposable element-derived protein 4-like [Cheilinus undulatus]|uniref:piggyBac transposable element-derived protein 4-like n=1 Tax=Cheilinus undulatus TaxID=241271 RepID=UPI001BD65E77|nr:piggyBac transposable element-derived protein 4-like [Cheilinus undulatus]
MFLSESDDELQELEWDSDSEIDVTDCSFDDDYTPRGLARGSQPEDFTDEDTSDEEWESTPAKRKTTRKRRSPASYSPVSSPLKSPFKSPPRKKINNASKTPKNNVSSNIGKTFSSPRGRNQRKKTQTLKKGMEEADFEDRWHDIDEEDIEPPQPKFRPERDVGPQLNRTSSYTPLDLFQLFFSTTVIDTLVKNTNIYGKKKHQGNKKSWVPVTAADMYSFLSLVLYMGIVPLKAMSDYWKGSQLFSLPFPGSIMPRTRFTTILSCLHLNDPAVEAANEKKKGTLKYDRLCKVKPLYEQILEACYTFYHPHQHISIDERMVATKAKTALKQYIKSKPTKWGFKLFVLADSACGYTLNFFVYSGKESKPSGKGNRYDIVMRLLNIPFLGKGYKLYVDNFYTSPKLFSDLLKKNIFSCGTVRTNVAGYPRKKPNDIPEKAPRGTIRWMRKGALLFVKWLDTREVTMCSTMHTAYSNDTANRSIKGADGSWMVKQVPVPGCIKDYNKYMGGVDLSDALIGYYNVLQKTTKWYKKLFYHFVDIATVNAFIIHKDMCKLQHQQVMSQKKFREELILALAAIGSTPNRASPQNHMVSPFPFKSPQKSQTSPFPAFSAPPNSTSFPFTEDPTGSSPHPLRLGHLPAYFTEHMKNVPLRDRGTAGRRQCVLCKMKSPIYCRTCLKTLCLTTSRNCYSEWHESNGITV